MSSYKDWFGKHKSSNFISLILTVGIVLLIIGIIIPTNHPILYYLSIIILQLSTICVTTSIVTIFFNFDDVKEYMSKSIGHLWIKGKIISSLSDQARTSIDKEIILNSSKNAIRSIDESLYSELTQLRNRALADFMMTNYNIRIVLTDSTYPNMLVRHMVSSYRINTFHLTDTQSPFPLRFEFSLNVSKSSNLSFDDLIPEFELKVDDTVYHKSDVQIFNSITGSLKSIAIKFEKNILIKHQYADVEMKLISLALKNNNNEVILMRYPTQGLNVSLQYTDEYDYEGCFFKALAVVKDLASINDHQNTYSNGISLSTNHWVLPGYGIVLGYYNKQE